MKARFIQRNDSIDYIPQTDIAAGDVVALPASGRTAIAKLDIKAGELGALAISGIFDVVKKSTEAFLLGANVYWSVTDGAATGSEAGNKYLGVCAAAAAAGDATVRVIKTI